jgi:hypothetical protein
VSPPIHPRVSRLVAAASLIVVAAVVLGSSGCGLLPPDTYVIRVDSVSVTSSAAPGTVRVQAFGFAGSDACGGLARVERGERADTLVRRFVGERRNGNCLQMPAPLEFTEDVAIPPGRTLRYLVQQPDGPPLVRDIPSP